MRLAVERILGDLQRERRPARERLGARPRRFGQRVGFDDGVVQADAMRLFGRDERAASSAAPSRGRGRRCAAAATPIPCRRRRVRLWVKRNAMRADGTAMRMSAAVAMTAPAPATVPLSAAMIGRRHWRIASTRSHVMCVNSSSPRKSRDSSGPMMSCTSPPVQNDVPAPVRTMARTPRRAVERAERAPQLVVDLEGQRVHALGAVQRQRDDAGGLVMAIKECGRDDSTWSPRSGSSTQLAAVDAASTCR